MIANLVGYWVLGLPLGFILCFVLKWGVYGMWIGLTLSLIVIASTLLVRWHRDSVAEWRWRIQKYRVRSSGDARIWGWITGR